MQTLTPTTPLEDAAGELIDDLHFTVLDDVVLVAVIEHRSAQCYLQLMHQVLLDLVVEVLDTECLLDLLDTRLRGHHDSLAFVDIEVDITLERSNDRCKSVVRLGRVSDTAGDDQRCARFVDENRVDFVDDRKVVSALDLVCLRRGHVVAEVVEAELVVRSVGDVGEVIDTLFSTRWSMPWRNQSDRQSEVTMDSTHPLGMELGEVVVDRDDVHSLARKGIQVGRERGDEGLSFTRLHFGHPTGMESSTAHQLNVEVTLTNHTACGLPHHREGLDHQVVNVLSALDPRAEFGGLGAQGIVAEGLHLRFEGVDLRHDSSKRLDLLALAGTEYAIKECHGALQATELASVQEWRPPPHKPRKKHPLPPDTRMRPSKLHPS